MGKGTWQAMEYKEELVHNVPVAAWNAIVSVAKKVEDNVLHMMTTLVIVPHPTSCHKTQWPTHHMPCLGHPMPLLSSRYAVAYRQAQGCKAVAWAHQSPELSNDTSYTYLLSVLYPGRSHGVISLGARPLKVWWWLNMGVAITLLMKKWEDAHGLTVKEKAAKYISGCQWEGGQDIGHNQHDTFAGAHIGAGRGKYCCLLGWLLPRSAGIWFALQAQWGARCCHHHLAQAGLMSCH